jgi:carboxyl-terminal processing protease
MRKKFIIPVILCVAVLCATAVVMSEAEKNKTKDDWYRQVELFSDAMALIRADYVTDVNPKDLIYGALRGMLSSLDPHIQFMDPETYGELRVDTEGKFGGLGIEITLKDGLLTVVTPIEDTPAWKAGLKANDRIVKIDDDLTRDMSLTDAVKKLRGKPGAAVTLTILRESESKILEFKMVRDIIKIKDIKLAKILEDGIGYIRLVEFRENTSADMEAVLKRLKSEGMRALVLDLRNNPGGLLDVAVNVAERFIQKGKMIVYTQGRRGSQDFKFVSRAANPILDLPMVILVNEGSASGSEIVAGCLQDHKRAIILGTKSFGKGSVQTVIPLSDGSALRLTTSKYFTPAGRQIHGKGVIPDIVVENARVEPLDMTALKNDKSKEVFDGLENKDSKQAKAQPAEYDYHLDNQLMHAIDVLKAIVIYKPA